MAGVDRSLAAKARKQYASLQPTPKADQAPQHDSTEGVTFDGKLLSIEGMDDHAPDASPQGEAHHDDPDVNAATAVPVEPASIEGLPIVEPTISPRQSDIENENLNNTKPPERSEERREGKEGDSKSKSRWEPENKK